MPRALILALDAVKVDVGIHPAVGGELLMRVAQGPVAVAVPESEPLIAEAPREEASEVLVEEELLVEDVSIDGMCGVY
jgi:mycofactocin precursor